MSKFFKIVAIVLLVAAGLIFLLGPAMIEKLGNKVSHPPPYQCSDRAKKIVTGLTIVDFHADSLLWKRNLLEKSTRGQVDIPRLLESNVALQVFTVVTKSPWFLNIERNSDRTDSITELAVIQRWPSSTWGSLKERALYQARKLHDAASHSKGKFIVIEARSDLDRYLKERRFNPTMTAGILGIEGAHALEGKLSNIDEFYDAGFRMIAPTHFFDNEWGGSAHGIHKGGLTELGKEMVRKLESKHILLDLAHASPALIEDALKIATRPMVVSHTGVKGTCNNARNLSDEEIKAIAAKGGVIGIGYWDTAVCGSNAAAIARAIRYTADVAGVEHVGLGSDFDGFVTTPFDVTGLPLIVDALLKEGFTEKQIRLIMGENSIRLLKESLP
jgi:membrane dipeptidase